jgi:hypothetical protein
MVAYVLHCTQRSSSTYLWGCTRRRVVLFVAWNFLARIPGWLLLLPEWHEKEKKKEGVKRPTFNSSRRLFWIWIVDE